MSSKRLIIFLRKIQHRIALRKSELTTLRLRRTPFAGIFGSNEVILGFEDSRVGGVGEVAGVGC